jgi:hypothetical protein
MSKLIIGPGRLSFVNLFTPKTNDQGNLVYTTAILLPPGYDIDEITEALVGAAKAKWGENRSKWPTLKRPPEKVIRPAEESDWYKGFPGWHFTNLSSSTAPGIIDAMKAKVTDEKQAYAGRWARISVNPFAYDGKGGKGVSLGLNNVQLLKHDEALAGKPKAEDEFDEYADADSGDDDWK